MSLQPIVIPDIGNFKQIPVIELLVKPGDSLSEGQSLLTLESDKATMEIPASHAGVVREIKLQVGSKVSAGDVILLLEVADVSASVPPPKAPVAAPAPEVPPVPPPALAPSRPEPSAPAPTAALPALAERGALPHASPTVRRFARELGADLSLVSGSGPKGRILREDVQAFVKQRLTMPAPSVASAAALPAAIPLPDFSVFGPTHTQALPRIKKLSGAHLQRIWQTVPQVTQFDQADITELEAFRKQQVSRLGDKAPKLTLLPFILKALAHACQRYPEFNSALDSEGEHLILKDYLNIGVAVDTPDGLVVPVLRDIPRKSALELAGELAELSQKARQRKLTASDMQGGCFTVSSLGGIGGTGFSPIVNAPEVAILGVAKAAFQPVYQDGNFIPRLMLPLALSYDHRVIDGAQGARFTRYLSELLSDIRQLLL